MHKIRTWGISLAESPARQHAYLLSDSKSAVTSTEHLVLQMFFCFHERFAVVEQFQRTELRTGNRKLVRIFLQKEAGCP